MAKTGEITRSDGNPSRLELRGGYELQVMSGRPPWYFNVLDKDGNHTGSIVFNDVPSAVKFAHAQSAVKARADGSTDIETVPEGWKLVPEEPTDEMLEAGDEVAVACGRRVDGALIENWREVYEVMLAAAPRPVFVAPIVTHSTPT